MIWNLESILHAFDHQENLDFVAIAFWVITALFTKGWETSSVRYAIYLERHSIAGIYVGNIPRCVASSGCRSFPSDDKALYLICVLHFLDNIGLDN